MSDARADKWMPFYVGDYLRDTGRLSTEGHGAYLLLILDYWTAGELPDDDEQLAAVTRMPLKAWKRLRPTMVRFFTVADGRWHHKRIDKELAKATEKSRKRAEAGRTGAAKRWETDGEPIANAIENASQTDGCAGDLQPQPHSGSSEPENKRAIEADFKIWYEAYPRKVAPGNARKAYFSARRKGTTAQQLLEGIDAYRRAKPDYADWAHPASWLNGERWLDRPSAPAAPTTVAAGMMPRPPDDLQERHMKLWREKGIWAEGWGPKPTTRAA